MRRRSSRQRRWLNLTRRRLKKFGNGIRPDRNEARIVIEIDLSRGFDPENTRIVEISLETSRQRRRQGSLGGTSAAAGDPPIFALVVRDEVGRAIRDYER